MKLQTSIKIAALIIATSYAVAVLKIAVNQC